MKNNKQSSGCYYSEIKPMTPLGNRTQNTIMFNHTKTKNI